MIGNGNVFELRPIDTGKAFAKFDDVLMIWKSEKYDYIITTLTTETLQDMYDHDNVVARLEKGETVLVTFDVREWKGE